jgi:hypothetical protein
MTGWRMSPRAYFFVAPSEARGPSALACLGRTRWEMSPRTSFFVAPRRQLRGLPGDAVPNEVRDASACARQDKVGRGLF